MFLQGEDVMGLWPTTVHEKSLDSRPLEFLHSGLSQYIFLDRPTSILIDIGKRSPAFPVTPPYVRVRIRRFGGLSD